ncbi:MAG TPA: (2Fe-2S)-binding protein [Mycobacteriales bacterium]|nr:(2Fe-2S)-binding protein [Mycobacteriales bacterium]
MTTTHTFRVNGQAVRVEVEDDVRLLWVLRDLLGIKGPKYGCGLNVCKACTSHINGKAFNPCSVPVGKIKPTDEITTIEGLPATVGADLHPMQQAWLDHDVAQCGYCQPGQIMAAVALVKEAQAQKRAITDADLDGIRNVCRCGTYFRVREAIRDGAAAMAKAAARSTAKTGAAAGKPPKVKPPQGALAATGLDPGIAVAGAAAVAAAVVGKRLSASAHDDPEPTAAG